MPKDWDDEYANSPHIPGAEAIRARFAPDAAAFRAGAAARLDVPYGTGARERFDLFLPQGTPKGLAVYIHGGYWMMSDKSEWSHFAAGCVARGFALAMPTYELAPAARLASIARQVASSIGAAAGEIAGPIVITGHSAGGQLAARLMSGAPLLPKPVLSRVRRVVAISGLFDLRPLMRTRMNETLKIDLAEAHAESPALLEPLEGPVFVAWIGGIERPEFMRQAALIANVWSGFDVRREHRWRPGATISTSRALKDPESDLVAALVG
ncbi:MAG: alpha/beta hydrolase [Alphaproteobacteria bacterium]